MQIVGTITNGISKILLAEHLLIFNTPPCWLHIFSSTLSIACLSPCPWQPPPPLPPLLPPHPLLTASRILGPRTRNNPPTSNMQQKYNNRCNNYNQTKSYHGMPLPGIQGKMPNDHAAPYANNHDATWLNIHLKKHCHESIAPSNFLYFRLVFFLLSSQLSTPTRP
jgi:hypothetical protein